RPVRRRDPATGQILIDKADPDQVWVCHIGGDDFILLLKSKDWQARCNAILQQFASMIQSYYSIEDRERGGYLSEDRQRVNVYCPLISLSIGIVKVEKVEEPRKFCSQHQIAAAAAETKNKPKNFWQQHVHRSPARPRVCIFGTQCNSLFR
ncbi:MAG: hypothetical protein ABI476_02670, partial [Oxalobacteraceae bacterium]